MTRFHDVVDVAAWGPPIAHRAESRLAGVGGVGCPCVRCSLASAIHVRGVRLSCARTRVPDPETAILAP
jgi:hypothetical protein